MENPNYYAIIPSNVRYDRELPASAKLLYGEITALCSKEGYCWATNAYFSELYGVSKRTVSIWINALTKKGYISSFVQRKDGTSEIIGRYIYIVPVGMEENFHRGRRKLRGGIEENFHPPMEENFQDNITSNITTMNTTKNRGSPLTPSALFLLLSMK